mmetsp:Transcript_13084/g.32106  ORF Transcript_13084/g.32106 Transcript_13084/m.32106 type:complete len:210 (-) Transcript_13084:44-673(-)
MAGLGGATQPVIGEEDGGDAAEGGGAGLEAPHQLAPDERSAHLRVALEAVEGAEALVDNTRGEGGEVLGGGIRGQRTLRDVQSGHVPESARREGTHARRGVPDVTALVGRHPCHPVGGEHERSGGVALELEPHGVAGPLGVGSRLLDPPRVLDFDRDGPAAYVALVRRHGESRQGEEGNKDIAEDLCFHFVDVCNPAWPSLHHYNVVTP